MRGMGPIAQGVDDPHVEALQEGAARLGNAFHVRRIGERAEAKAERVDLAVVEIERRRLDRPARPLDAAEPAGGQAQLVRDRRIGTARQEFEKYKRKPARTISDVGSSMWMSRRRPHDEAERPQIVDAVRVIGVRMGHEDAVEPPDAGVDQLLAQVGRSVDENGRRAARARRARRAPSSGGGGSSGSPDRRRPTPARRAARPPTSRSPGWSAATSMRDSKACGGLPKLRAAPASLRKTACVLARVAAASASAQARAPRRPRPPSRRQRPARCAGRDGASARDRARRSRPGCGRAARRARWRAEPSDFLNVTTPENEIHEPKVERRLGERARRGEAVEQGAEPPLPHLLGQDRGDVVVGVAGVDDERQVELARERDLAAEDAPGDVAAARCRNDSRGRPRRSRRIWDAGRTRAWRRNPPPPSPAASCGCVPTVKKTSS